VKAFDEASAIRKATGSPGGRLLLRYAMIFIEKPLYESDSCPPLYEPVRSEAPDRPKELETADKYLKQASGIIQKDNLEDQLLLAYAMAKVTLETEPKNSLDGFRKLKDEAKSLGARKYFFLASTCEGLACERLKKLDEAKKSYLEAESYISGIEKELTSDDRTSFRQGEQILGIKNDLAAEGLKRLSSV
jgi:hypothetical protein